MIKDKLKVEELPQLVVVQAPVLPRRPVWLSLPGKVLILLYAFLSLAGWVRMIYSIVSWSWLIFVGVWPGPWYLVITGGLWGVTGLAGVLWLRLGRRWSRLVGLGAALVFALTYWLDQLVVDVSDGGPTNAVFAALLTMVGLAFALLVLRPFDDLRALFKRPLRPDR